MKFINTCLIGFAGVVSFLLVSNTWAVTMATGSVNLSINGKQENLAKAYATLDSFMAAKQGGGEKTCQSGVAVPDKEGFNFYSDVGKGGCETNFTRIVFHPKAGTAYPKFTIKMVGTADKPFGGDFHCKVALSFKVEDGKITDKAVEPSGECTVELN